MYLAVLGAAVCSSSAWAGWWSNQDFGAAKTDGGTRAVARQQGNKYSDWFWQGKNEGLQFRCPTNHPAATCRHTFNVNSSKSTSLSQGFRIGLEGKFKEQELSAAYNRQYSRTQTTGHGSTLIAQVSRGHYTQPVAVQERRWTKGVFHGAHFKTQTRVSGKNTNWYYDWAWRDFGSWTSYLGVGKPYYTVVYKSTGPF
jgi:hypothetical protein